MIQRQAIEKASVGGMGVAFQNCARLPTAGRVSALIRKTLVFGKNRVTNQLHAATGAAFAAIY